MREDNLMIISGYMGQEGHPPTPVIVTPSLLDDVTPYSDKRKKHIQTLKGNHETIRNPTT